MQLKIKFISLFILLAFYGIAQDSIRIRKEPHRRGTSQPSNFSWDKVYVGGNVGLQFGTVTFMELSPLAGYRINDKVSAGVGVTYQYYHYQDRMYDISTNVYGGRVFGRYMFTENIFGHGEYEYLNLEAFDFFPSRRVDVGSLLAGVGYIQHISRNSGIVAMLLYNFTESTYTPYTNPIIRIGLNIGL